MKIKSEKLEINKSLYNKLNNLCMFSKDITLDVINGIVFKVLDTNICYLEPHRFVLRVKGYAIVLLCYDNLHLCLYEREKTKVAYDYIKTAVSYRDIAKGAEPLRLYECNECGNFDMMTIDYEEDKIICFDYGNIRSLDDYKCCSECSEPMDKNSEMCMCDDRFTEKVNNSD